MKEVALRVKGPRVARAAVSQNEIAYGHLKDALVTLAYRPGDYLNTAQVMERFDLGRTPVNQALHRLAAEGLVRVIPRKGAIAAPLSIDAALELIEVRLVNEELCLRLAAKAVTDAELRALSDAALAFERLAGKPLSPALTNADRKFHELIARASRNAMLEDILKVLHARAQRFWAISLSSEGHVEEVVDEHRAILAALRARDPDAAAGAVREHILSFRDSMVTRPT